jgi:hypothetical protein
MALSACILATVNTPENAGSMLRHDLSGAGVTLVDTPHDSDASILLFRQWEGELAANLQAASAQQTLAICCEPAALAADTMWEVLAAGASDLLLWPSGEPILPQVVVLRPRAHLPGRAKRGVAPHAAKPGGSGGIHGFAGIDHR